MHDVYFALLGLRGIGTDGLVGEYVAWMLGTGAFERLRDRRLDLGVAESWEPAAVAAGGAFTGLDGCTLGVARAGSGTRVWFHHPDDRDPDVEWQTVAHIDPGPGLVLLRHGARRVATSGAALEALAPGAPGVLASLLDRRAIEVEPAALRASAPVSVSAESAAAWTRDVLLASDRAAPLVIASATRLDPQRLTRSLRGMATVAVPADEDAADAIDRALVAEGLSATLGSAATAARLYRPELRAHPEPANHPGYPHARMSGPPGRRTTALAARIAADIAERTMPEGFFEGGG